MKISAAHPFAGESSLLAELSDWFIPLLATLLFGSVFIADAWQSYNATRTDARRTLSAYTRAAQITVQAELLRLDSSLQGITAEIREAAHGQRKITAAAINALNEQLARRRAALLRQPDLYFINRHGTIVASSNAAMLGKDFSQNDSFIKHAKVGGEQLGLIIGKPRAHKPPNPTPVSLAERPVVDISRAVLGPSREFIGVVMAAVAEDALQENLHTSLPAGYHSIALLDREGDLFAQYPPVSHLTAPPDISTVTWKARPDFIAHQERTMPFSDHVAKATATEPERMIAYHAIEGERLLVAMARDTREVFASWQQNLKVRGAVLLVTLILIYWFRYRSIRRQSAFAVAHNRFAALIENSEDVIVIIDRSGRISWISPSINHLTGMQPADVIGDLVSKAIHRDDQTSFALAMQRLQSEANSRVTMYYHIYHRHRGWFPIEGVATSHYDTPGIMGAVIVFRDVSEREARSLALQQSEQMLNDAQQIASLGSWRYDPNKDTVVLSDEARRILGVSDTSELTGRAMFGFISKASRPMVATAWAAALQGEEFDIGASFEIGDSVCWVHARASFHFDDTGQVNAVVGTLQDVTAQHLAATQLAELLAFNETVIAASSIGIGVLEANGTCVLANDAIANMLGTTRETVMATNFMEGAIWRNAGLPQLAERALREQQSVHHMLTGISRFDKPIALDIELVPITWQGAPHLLFMSMDFTAIQEAGKAMEDGMRMAEQANRAKSEFLANMSHEIRTPMNAIIGLAQLALDRTADPTLREYLQQMVVSANALMEIINDILDYSKIEAGRLTIEPHEFAVRDITARVLGMFRQAADAKGLTLTTDIAPDVPARVIGDSVRIGQIIVNLVANAIKFTDSGTVSLHIARHNTTERRPTATDFSSAEHETITLDFLVSDTGIGMSESELGQLFRPFEQADGSITRRYGGTGLGLSISRRLATLMNGTIDVTSSPGQGSCFSLQLTLQARIEHQPESTSMKAQALGQARLDIETRAKPIAGTHVLLVEDDRVNQMVITRLLQRAKLHVTVAQHGQEALNILKRHRAKSLTDNTEAQPFAAILMDLQMPVMDGFAATREIRANPYWANVPIIAVTAAVLTHDRDSCLAAGMNAYVAKPVQPMLLIDTLVHQIAPASVVSGQAPKGIATTDTAITASQPGPASELRLRLHALQERLAGHDFISVSELSELRTTLNDIAGARAARLESLISRYDYAAAQRLLADIINALPAE